MQHHVNKLEIFRGHQNSVIFSGVEKYIRMLSSSTTRVFIETIGTVLQNTGFT